MSSHPHHAQIAAIYALLGRIFVHEMDRQGLRDLRRAEVASVFEKLNPGFTDYLDTLTGNEQLELLAADYCDLFILPTKSGGSLRASHWMTEKEAANLPRLEALIASRERDSSAIQAGFNDLPNDHLGVLLYFVGSVYASDQEDVRKLGAAIARLAFFPWIFDFHDKLLASSQNPLYSAACKLLVELLESELEDGHDDVAA